MGVSIDSSTEFGKKIRKVILDYKPNYVIETGTRFGDGSTRCILEALNLLNRYCMFHTIEISKINYKIARGNLKPWFDHEKIEFEIYGGCSLAKDLLPNQKEINNFVQKFTESLKVKRLKVRNFDVIENKFEKYNLLEFLMCEFGYPDMLLLDSEGYLGYQEFRYVFDVMKEQKFILLLDDIYSMKHYYALTEVVHNPKFKILYKGDERDGFCIARYEG